MGAGRPAGRVLVRTPATSANLGPGFDSLGLALALYDDVEVELTGGGVTIEVDGEGAAEVADRGERHLIVRVLRSTFDVIDELAGSGPGQPDGIRLRCRNRIPHSRGLGSSSAAIVAGIVAARALHPEGKLLDDEAVLRLATDIEGHPDNVAPCISGGLTVAWTAPGGPRSVRLDPQVGGVVVFVPGHRLATERARGLLPATVPHGDAAANAGRAALLIAALAAGVHDVGVLLDATEDRIHQDYRAPAMPESAALVKRLRDAGVPAVISGAGPTVLAFTNASRVDSMRREVGKGWHEHPLDIATRGACVMTGETEVRD